MKIMTTTLALTLILILGGGDAAQAHSTEGRVRIDLSLKQPGVDDFAYFMEYYVHNELHRDREPQWKGRFYVKTFDRVEREGNRAVVYFDTLDLKNRTDFADSMTFARGSDGLWRYTSEEGEQLVVYTYVTKVTYYYQKFVLPLSIAGLSLAVIGLGLLRLRRKRRQQAAAASGAAVSMTSPDASGDQKG
ncbi:hypothetical protein [Desulfobulbus alkaliphilus]|uniref:hypothetical protein n=1 Tax=Desulfobulbus alkaliphilus TaxID=869814 RepID=UPI0019630980|nr:hypothetical protein [Desulfobulbus alkaliphilus]MBM9536581.1 hypothetical protein [Desulfobulbus alkaliphilus]